MLQSVVTVRGGGGRLVVEVEVNEDQRRPTRLTQVKEGWGGQTAAWYVFFGVFSFFLLIKIQLQPSLHSPQQPTMATADPLRLTPQ